MHPPIHQHRRHSARLPALAAAMALLLLGCQHGTPLEPAGAQLPGNDPAASAQPAPPKVTPAIRFGALPPASITVRIYDVQGGLVRTIKQDLGVGVGGIIEWDGLTDSGNPVGSGMYQYVLDISNGTRLEGTLIVAR